jgi:hypothetical protein
LQSEIFVDNKEYVRKQIIYSLLQEDEPATIYVIASFLLFAGRQDEATFESMNHEGCFSRLVDLIKLGKGADARLHRLLLGLLYEMSRMQRLSVIDLSQVDDNLITGLFTIIEELSDDVDDPYHYPVIRVLVSRTLQLKACFLTNWSSLSLMSNIWFIPQLPRMIQLHKL